MRQHLYWEPDFLNVRVLLWKVDMRPPNSHYSCLICAKIKLPFKTSLIYYLTLDHKVGFRDLIPHISNSSKVSNVRMIFHHRTYIM